ncbi:16S rRNA (cytosine(967)-C(5))-methyltransferase RsmB [Alcaligenaceae bacterium CGII-47]|nr:16S rRNA (cytosine(967)-C(5))-methyltransferase RsmB [Alcaligenaceae bacterium CGII-47]
MPPKAPSIALSRQLLAAAHNIQDVLSGQSLSESLAHTPTELRAAAQALSFYAMRHLGLAHGLRDMLVSRTPPDPLTDALLLLSLCLMDSSLGHAQDGADTSHAIPVYAPHTLVNQAVEAAMHHPKSRAYKGLINAVLRRFGRERDPLLRTLEGDPVAQWNHPQWWIDTLQTAWPQYWQVLLQAANTPGPMTLRANRRQNTPEQLQNFLDAAGIHATLAGQDGVILSTPQPVQAIPGFAQGRWSVQDLAAQLAGRLLPVADGMRVLDACAAPGGKTAHLLERHSLALTALDSDPQRLERVAQNLDRLRLTSPSIRLCAGDAAHTASWWDGEPFDAILADVPCTASGVVRRHPDIRWLRRAEDLPRTAALQQRIIDALWRVLRPGGHLLYVTCSIFPIEGEQQILAFLARHADALRLAAPGYILPHAESSAADQTDGFFYALIAKRG